MIVQQMLEDVAGQPLETVARAHLFDPLGMHRSTADSIDADTIEVTIADGAMRIQLPDGDEPSALQPLSPARFAAATTQYEFHRDAHGKVRAMSVEQGSSRAYYRRVAD